LYFNASWICRILATVARIWPKLDAGPASAAFWFPSSRSGCPTLRDSVVWTSPSETAARDFLSRRKFLITEKSMLTCFSGIRLLRSRFSYWPADSWLRKSRYASATAMSLRQ
jgi:hypothetical protein